MCWANKIFFIMIFLLAITSVLMGCGNKGDLRLPDQNKQASEVIPPNKTNNKIL